VFGIEAVRVLMCVAHLCYHLVLREGMRESSESRQMTRSLDSSKVGWFDEQIVVEPKPAFGLFEQSSTQSLHGRPRVG
jgi:hypothetical protein